ncbi:hypothetical protein PO909_014447 [Leuciscus waleckii]
MNRREERFWAGDKEFCFIAVEFKKVIVHPGFNVGNAIGDGGEDSRGDGFGGHVELGIIGVAVKMESMVADDLTEGKHVDGEEEGPEHGTLGDTMGDRGGVGVAVVNRDKVVTVREVGGEPEKCCARDANRFKTMEEDGMVYCVKCSGEVEEKEEGYGTRVGSNEEIICDFNPLRDQMPLSPADFNIHMSLCI